MLDLNLDLRTEPVKLDGVEYTLSEMDGPGQVVYDNFRFDHAVMGEDGVRTIKNLAELEPLKVSLCLREKDTGALVSLDRINDPRRPWPGRVVSVLADRIDDLGKLSEDDAKKLRPDTTSGSA